MSAGDPAELDTDALPSFPDPGVLLAAVGLPSRAIREVLGVERIAAQWADRNGVHQIVCQPDWDRHGRAAPFRRNDELLNLQPETPEQRIVQALADAETPPLAAPDPRTRRDPGDNRRKDSPDADPRTTRRTCPWRRIPSRRRGQRKHGDGCRRQKPAGTRFTKPFPAPTPREGGKRKRETLAASSSIATLRQAIGPWPEACLRPWQHFVASTASRHPAQARPDRHRKPIE